MNAMHSRSLPGGFVVSNRIRRWRSSAGRRQRSVDTPAATVKSVPSNNEMHIVNPPKGDKLAYPISTFTYVILPTKSSKAADLRKFVFYAVNPTQGEKLGPKLLFAPLPKVVLVAAEKTLKKIGS